MTTETHAPKEIIEGTESTLRSDGLDAAPSGDCARFDFAGPLGKFERTPQGFLRIPSNATRTGVLTYRMADGSVRRELRHPEDVFHADSMRSLAYAPVTDLHPDTGLVTPKTAREVSRGVVQENVRKDGKYVRADLIVQDEGLIAAIERGERKELSPGYTCKLDMTPGEWDGEKYDARQRAIVYNHLALGPHGWGRSGSEVSLRLDGGEASTNHAVEYRTDEGTQNMETTTIHLDGSDFTVPVVHAEDLVKKFDHLSSKLSEAQAKADAETARADAADTKVKELEERAPVADSAAVAARVALEKAAQKVAGEDFKCDGLSDHELRCAVVKTKREDSLEGKSPEYVAGIFDVLHADALRAVEKFEKLSETLRVDGDGKPPASGRDKYAEASRNAWKTPALTK